jgi:CheY-like chemotaxis protein
MRHVLVIEDQWLFAQVMADIALCAGASSVAIADTEDQALVLARIQLPALILSDVDLQDGGRGPNAVGRIHQEFGPVPAIFITGAPRDAQTLDYASAILVKPISPNQLLMTFRDVIHWSAPPGAVH